jgi:Na+/H+ antiporter NhaC
MHFDKRLKILFAIIVVAIIAMFNVEPIAQDPAYHNFADQRRILGMANFFNVLSNLPFVIIGIMGIRLVALHKASGGLAELQAMYLTFFIGTVLIGLGSAYYHYRPDNHTLLILGIVSVAYWQVTELNGRGDLRAYALVQFLPALLIPLILWLFDSKLNGDQYIWGIVGAYAVSKLMELFDDQLYNVFSLLSGHSLKHLFAAFATLLFYWALRKRRRL